MLLELIPLTDHRRTIYSNRKLRLSSQSSSSSRLSFRHSCPRRWVDSCSPSTSSSPTCMLTFNHIVYIEVSNIHSSWFTAFIFSAQDYSTRRCYFAIPAGLNCKRKRANEAFIFLALYVACILVTAVNC